MDTNFVWRFRSDRLDVSRLLWRLTMSFMCHLLLCFYYDRKTHCATCKLRISENSSIYRLSNHIFHEECFNCSICSRHPLTGERVVFSEGQISCTSHCPVPMQFSKLQWNPQKTTQNNHSMHSLFKVQHNDISKYKVIFFN